MLDYSKFKCEWLDKEEIWRRADEFFMEYWQEAILPVNMEKIVEERLNLNIEPERHLKTDHDMDAFLRRDLTGIVVDYDCYMEDRFQNRMRFSLAHEVGHLILHRYTYKNLPASSPDEWKEFILNMPDKEYASFEWQANEFAGRLLVPRGLLIQEIKDAYEELKSNQILIDYLERNPDAVLARVSPKLCKPFGVSTEVIERRVDRESLWPPLFD